MSDALTALLAAVPHTLIDHDAATTAREAAAARGTTLGLGGKSIVMKADRLGFVVLAVGSDRRIDGRMLRQALHIQKYRFATPEELQTHFGLPPGAVPPFGRPLFEATLYAGEDLVAREEIVFAAASRTRSVRMAVADWRRVAAPVVVPTFTVAEGIDG